MAVRIAALGDLHAKSHARGQYKDFFAHISDAADVVVLCGDLTDTGLPEEAHILAEDIVSATVPVCGVFGNHDYHSGRAGEVRKILCEADMHFLDEEPLAVDDALIVGVKGFGGGFGKYMLSSFGEELDKRYVQESVNEALTLERFLLGASARAIAVALHYAPIEETVHGEAEALFPFLGSSRLEDAIDRSEAKVVFHGHAHHGAHAGKTMREIPVFNVARAVLASIGKQYLSYEI